MKEYKVPIQSLIDHIKTSVDVDPWAKEMAEELLKSQPQIVICGNCKHGELDKYGFVSCNKCESHELDWFCADGEKTDE